MSFRCGTSEGCSHLYKIRLARMPMGPHCFVPGIYLVKLPALITSFCKYGYHTSALNQLQGVLTCKTADSTAPMYYEEMRPPVFEIPAKTSGEGVAATISLDGDNDMYIFLKHSFRDPESCHPDFHSYRWINSRGWAQAEQADVSSWRLRW
ncbi:hypothetical protein DEU56DRAFT_978023 [Suillus clintonianus]|uniref:uncharacterized protein n=1 Tax=Suillus clintonianus TaxID=1904413 RepID=UPI001B8832A8|nr:uncharacterized protein DEU56DRAFT_978023 [Suillus clintonianus]KAG2149364.1 hypothetical protein DEU56DRAFT_978023 [Suillus clintonianus]